MGTAPATTTVPAVTGDPAGGAVSALRAAGFKVNQTIRVVTNPAKNGTVVAQSPGGNSTAKKGSTVTITVGQLAHTSSSSTSTSTTTTTSTTKTTTSPTTSSTSTTTSQGQ